MLPRKSPVSTLTLGIIAGLLAPLAALAQSIDVTAPGAGTAWTVGESVAVEWTSSDLSDELYISLMIVTDGGDSGAGFLGYLTVGQGRADFVVPDWLPDGADYRVRFMVVDQSGLSIAAWGESPLISITESQNPLSFNVSAPSDSTVWSADPAFNPHDVQWSGSVELADTSVFTVLCEGSQVLTLQGLPPGGGAMPTVGDGGFSWQIPHNIGDGSNYWLLTQVMITGDFCLVALTPAFQITDALSRPTLNITGLSDDGQWQADQTATIDWSVSGSLIDGETVYAMFPYCNPAVSAATTTGQSEFCLDPRTDPGDYSATAYLLSADMSLAFSIVNSDPASVAAPDLPAVDLTWPVGGEVMDAGVTYSITWDADGIDGEVAVDLFKGGQYYDGIANAPAVDGQCEWTVPFDVVQDGDYTVGVKSLEWETNCAGTIEGPYDLSDPVTMRGNSISGTVRNAEGQELAGILVELRLPQEGWDEGVAFAYTDDYGVYAIAGVPGGVYTLRAGGEFDLWEMTTPEMNPDTGHWYRRAWTANGFDDAQRLCESMGGYLATVTSAEENEWISQTLDAENACFGATDRDEEGVWRWIDGEPLDYTNWHSGLPDNMGGNEHYVEWWSDGTWNDVRTVYSCMCEYDVEPAPQTNYARIYYPDEPYSADAELIAVEAGVGLTGYDFTLPKGSMIQGHVHDAETGLPVAEIRVAARFSQWDSVTTDFLAYTDNDGFYVFRHLPTGVYDVEIDIPEDESAHAGYMKAMYGGELPCPQEGVPIVIEAPQTFTGIDLDLYEGATISGVVTDGGIGVEGVDVDARGFECGHVGSTTDPNGAFVIRGLPEDSYAIYVHPNEEDWFAWEAFDDKPCNDQANRFQVYSGMHLSGVDFELDQAGFVAGVVYDEQTGEPLRGARIRVFWWDGVDQCYVEIGRVTDVNGGYFVNLAPGDYLLTASRHGYLEEYYDGAFDPSTATPITVAAGATVENVDFYLNETYCVSGMVQDALTTTPLSGVSLCALPVSGEPDFGNCTVSINGEYTVDALINGEYELIASAEGYCDVSLPLLIDGADVEEFLVAMAPRMPADLDCDNDVDLADLAGLLGRYGECLGDPLYDPVADFDDNGCIELSDLAYLLSYYGT